MAKLSRAKIDDIIALTLSQISKAREMKDPFPDKVTDGRKVTARQEWEHSIHFANSYAESCRFHKVEISADDSKFLNCKFLRSDSSFKRCTLIDRSITPIDIIRNPNLDSVGLYDLSAHKSPSASLYKSVIRRLIAFDKLTHPEPAKFDRWAECMEMGWNECPYRCAPSTQEVSHYFGEYQATCYDPKVETGSLWKLAMDILKLNKNIFIYNNKNMNP